MTRAKAQRPPSAPPRHVPRARALFAAFACFYALTGVGYVCSPDGAVMLRVAESLLAGEGGAIRELERWPGFGGARVEDRDGGSKFYAKYGLGLSLAAVPGVLVGQALLPLAPQRERDLFETEYEAARRLDRNPDDARFTLADPELYRVVWYRTGRENFAEVLPAFFASLTNATIGGAIVATVFLIAVELGGSPAAALFTAAATGLATPLWHYSRTFFAEPLASWGLMVFLLGALRARRSSSARAWLASGAGLGLSVLAKPVHAVLLPAALLYLAPWRSEWRRPRRRTDSFAFGIGLLVPIATALAYNELRFGSLLETGYGAEAARWTTPWAEGLRGLLLSPGRGFLFHHPLWILAALGFPAFARRAPREAVFVALTFATLLFTYATWHQWEGGWCWGPRFLSVAIPPLMLPVAVLFDEPPRRRALRCVVGAVVVAGVIVAANGIVVHYVDYLNWLKHDFDVHRASFPGVRNYYERMCWSWDAAPLLRYWTFEPKDPFFAVRCLRAPGVVLATYVLVAFGCVIATREVLRKPRAPAALPRDAKRTASGARGAS